MTTLDVTNPDEADEAEMIIRAAQGPILISQPARVLSYDKDTQTARVQPLVEAYEVNWEAETEGFESLDAVSVPVAFPGGNGFQIVFDIEEGVDGILVFCERDTKGWEGTAAGPAPPPTRERFNEAFGYFIPEVRAPANPRDSSRQNHANGPTFYLDGIGDRIHVGDSGANKALVTAPKATTKLNTRKGIFDGHFHQIVAALPGGSPKVDVVDPSNPAIVVGKVNLTDLITFLGNALSSAPTGTKYAATVEGDLDTKRINVDK